MKNLDRENYMTYHCCGRMEERVGLCGEEAQRMARNALKKGKTAWEMKNGREKKYLSKKSDDGAIALAYNGFCFLVSKNNHTCITVYELPEWFGKTHIYEGKKEIKDVSRYKREIRNGVYDCFA